MTYRMSKWSSCYDWPGDDWFQDGHHTCYDWPGDLVVLIFFEPLRLFGKTLVTFLFCVCMFTCKNENLTKISCAFVQYNILMCIIIITICIILFPLMLYLRELSSIRVWMSMMKILILKTLMSWNLVWVLKRYEMILPEENSKYNNFLNTITSLISVLLDPVCRPYTHHANSAGQNKSNL